MAEFSYKHMLQKKALVVVCCFLLDDLPLLQARDEQMKPMAPIILSGILKLLDKPPPGEGGKEGEIKYC